MKRVLVTVVGAVALAFLIVLPALGIQTSSPTGSDEETTISQYDAVYDVGANGDLAATETLHVDFPTGDKHGIFRFFDRYDPSATHALRTPHDIAVSMDGQPEPVSLSHESHDRYVVARIGDPDLLLPSGTHVYTISYRIDGVLEPTARGPSSTGTSSPEAGLSTSRTSTSSSTCPRRRLPRSARSATVPSPVAIPVASAPPPCGSTAAVSRRTRR